MQHPTSYNQDSRYAEPDASSGASHPISFARIVHRSLWQWSARWCVGMACLMLIGVNLLFGSGLTPAQAATATPTLVVSPTSFTGNTNCSYSLGQGWTCTATLSRGDSLSTNLRWTTSSTPGVVFTPSTGVLAPGGSASVSIAVPDTVCPSKTAFSFKGPANTVKVPWSCAPPTLTVTPNSFVAGTSCPVATGGWTCTATLGESASSQGQLTWHATTALSGVTFTPANGTLSPGGSTPVSVFVPSSACVAGSFIFTGVNSNVVRTTWKCTPPITAKLTVKPTTLSPTSTSCTSSGGSSQCTVTLSETASSQGNVNWSASSSLSGVSFTPSSGTLAPGGSVQVTIASIPCQNSTFTFAGGTGVTSAKAAWSCTSPPPPPTLTVTPTSLDPTRSACSATGSTYQCAVSLGETASSQGNAHWSASSNLGSGVSFNPASGQLTPGGSVAVTISSLPCQNGTMTFSGAEGETPVTVSWSCTAPPPPPTLTVSPTSLDSTNANCSATGSTYLCSVVLNAQGGNVNWSASASASLGSSVTFVPASGTLAPGTPQTVTIGSLPCQNGSLTFAGQTGVTPVNVSWSCTPPPPPTLTVSPSSLNSTNSQCSASGSTYQCAITLGESASSQGNANWSVQSDLGSSVSFNPSSGQLTPGSSVTVTISSLPCQNGTMTFSGAEGETPIKVSWSCTPPPTVIVQNISATAGVSFSGTVATVTDGAASQLSASIDWGDGSSPSVGTINGSGPSFSVSGSHTYTKAGSFPITISVTDATTGQNSSGSGTATVTVAAVQVTGQNITASAGAQFSGQVATVSDAAAAQSSQLSASIDWGDGSPTSAGTVSGSGPFTVSGSHTYTIGGNFPITISVKDTTTGQSGSGSGMATVPVPAPVQVSGQNITVTAGIQFSRLVATVSDTAAGGFYQLSATIDWGDGSSPSQGTVIGAYEFFTIIGSHTYAKAGSFTLSISVKDTLTGQSGSGSGQATVNAPLTVSGQNITATVDVQFSGQVATVTGAAQASDLTATIAWGDGTSSTSQGTVGGSGPSFTVSGSHTYIIAGSYSITVTVTDTATSQSGTGTGTATVTEAPVQVSSQNITATAGVQFSGQVATISDAAATGPGQLSVSIDWGDKTGTTTGTVSGANGTFTISGSHTYATPGFFGPLITVTDTTTGQIGNAIDIATVNSPLSVRGQDIVSIAGVPFSGQVATVTGAAQASDLTATINWGDGSSPSAATVSGSGPSFTISGSHTYATAKSSYLTTITVTDTAINQTNSGNGTATVGVSPVSVSGQNITATAGVQFSGQVATVSDTGASSPSQISATIDWGDNTGPYTGTVSGANGSFTVSGSHTYAKAGSFTITISVLDTATNQYNGSTSTATVTAPVQVSGQNIAATVGVPFSGQVATVSDASASQPSQLNASINWGDGSGSTAGPVSGANGSFTVSGSHTYAKAGSFTITVSVTDTTTGQSGSGSGTSTVTAPVQVSGQNITATASVQFSGPVATVTDTAASQASQLTALIDWGDGTATSAGTVSGSNGNFSVSGTHTYATGGSYPLTIAVTDTSTQQTGFGTGKALVIAALTVTPTSLDQNSCTLAGNLYSCTVTLAESQGSAGTAHWTASSNLNGVSFSPASGTLSPGTPVSVTISSLPCQNGTITFSGAEGETPVTVSWSCTSGTISATPSSLDPTTPQCSPMGGTANYTCVITLTEAPNAGQPVNWSATSTLSGVTLTPPSGVLLPGLPQPIVIVSIPCQSGVFTISGGNVSLTVAWSCVPPPPPMVTVSPSSLSSSSTQCAATGSTYQCQLTLGETASSKGNANWSVSTDLGRAVTFNPARGQLTPGSSISISISAIPCQNGSFTFSGQEGETPVTVSWSCTPPPPTLTVTPTSLDRSNSSCSASGSAFQCTVTLGETASSQGNASWTVSSDLGSSVTFNPSSGQLTPGSSVPVTISSLPCQNGTITFTGQTGVAPVIVPWSCAPSPTLTVTPTSLDSTKTSCSSASPCNVTLGETASSQGNANWTVSSNLGSGVSINPASGQLTPGSSVTVTISSLPCQNGTITFSGQEGETPVTVSWSCTPPPPTLTVSPSNLDATNSQCSATGSTYKCSVTLSESASSQGNANWHASSNPNGVFFNPPMGHLTPGSSVTVTISSLPCPDDTLTFSGAEGETPISVSWSCTKLPPPNLIVTPTSLDPTNSQCSATGSTYKCSVSLSSDSSQAIVNWQASSNLSGVSFTPANGQVTPGNSVTVTFSSLPCPNDTVTFSGAEGETPVTVSWSCTPPPPTLTVNTYNLVSYQSYCSASGSTYQCAITLGESTSSQANANWSVKSDLGSGVSFSPSSGQLTPGNLVTVTISSLPCQHGTVTFSGAEEEPPVSVSWSCTPPSPPALTVSPSSLSSTASQCSASGSTYQCAITLGETASSQGNANWTVSSNLGSGVSINPASGQLTPGSSVIVTISSLPCQNGTITFSGSEGETPITVSWTCTPPPPPTLTVTPTSLDPTNSQCSATGSTYLCAITLGESASSQGNANWTVSSNLGSGVSINPISGQLTPGSSISVTISSLPCQNGTITFSGAEGETPVKVSWSCTPPPPPTLTVSPANMNPSTLSCGPMSPTTYQCYVQLALAATANGPVSWSASSTLSGVSFSPSNGQLLPGRSTGIMIMNVPCQNGTFTFAIGGPIASWSCTPGTIYATPSSLDPTQCSLMGGTANYACLITLAEFQNSGQPVNWSATSTLSGVTFSPPGGVLVPGPPQPISIASIPCQSGGFTFSGGTASVTVAWTCGSSSRPTLTVDQTSLNQSSAGFSPMGSGRYQYTVLVGEAARSVGIANRWKWDLEIGERKSQSLSV